MTSLERRIAALEETTGASEERLVITTTRHGGGDRVGYHVVSDEGAFEIRRAIYDRDELETWEEANDELEHDDLQSETRGAA